MFILLAVNSVNAPFWDQWRYAGLLDKLHSGTLTFHDLWQQHNEHRILVPEVIQLCLAVLTHWNVRYEVFLNFAAVAGTYALLVGIMWRSLTNRLAFALVSIVLSLVLFSPLAYINWIWGFDFVWFFSALCTVGTVWALQRWHNKANPTFNVWFWVAAAIAVAGTYSLGNGLLVWPACLLMLWLQGADKKIWLTWILIGTAAVGLYFYHFTFSGDLVLSIFWHQPLEALQYLVMFLGHNFGATDFAAGFAGTILLLAAIGCTINAIVYKRLVKLAPMLTLAAFGIMTGLLAITSRLHAFGVEQSMSYSYVTASSMFVVGVIGLIGATIEQHARTVLRWPATWLLVIGCSIGVLLYPLGTGYVDGYLTGAQKMHEQSMHLQKVRACIYTAQTAQDDCLLAAYPSKPAAWQYIQILHKIHWGSF